MSIRRLAGLFVIAFLFTGCQVNLIPSTHGKGSGANTLAADAPDFTPIWSETKSPTELDNHSMRINAVDGVTLVIIPAGSFEMGEDENRVLALCEDWSSNCRKADFLDESPLHQVELTEFWIYQTEVSNQQYKLCVDAGVCDPPGLPEFFMDERFDAHPVVYVDWFSSETYCKWAGGRLPTEAEWEKAARGTDGRIFPWGDSTLCGFANIKGCSNGLTTPVGSFPAGSSPYGILDMAGNVAEWVADWYDPGYYHDSPQLDPMGPITGEMRVVRGGSWKNPVFGVRATNRGANLPEIFSTGVGFRCVMDSKN